MFAIKRALELLKASAVSQSQPAHPQLSLILLTQFLRMATPRFISATIFLVSAVFLEQMLLGATSLIVEEDASNIGSGFTPQVCSLVRHTINFKDLGLEFIVQPKSINVGKCEGFCPEIGGFPNHFYYKLLRYSGREVNTCCVPLEFEGIEILTSLYDPTEEKNVIKLHVLANATVTKCGCR